MNNQYKQQKQSDGFTLIELTVTIALFGIIGATLMSLMINALRGSNKTTAIDTVRQNGDYAISQMSRLIRPAASLTTTASCLTSGGTPLSSIQITGLDGGITTYACSNGTVSSNSASLLDTSSVKTTSCQFSCQQKNASDSPIVTIQFSLAPLNTTSLAERTVQPITFQTSILMRNANQ